MFGRKVLHNLSALGIDSLFDGGSQTSPGDFIQLHCASFLCIILCD